MKRRCALLRALLAPCDMFIFDEPFTGLDEKTKDRVIRYLLEKTDGRPVLMSTHDRNDAGALGLRYWNLIDGRRARPHLLIYHL